MAVQTDSRTVYTRTKTRVPALATEVIRRPRLLAMLEQSRAAAVTLIQAPAGYGKTNLLQQWDAQLAASGAVVAWFTPDPNDQDAEVFLSYLVHALAEAGYAVSESIRSMVTTESIYSWRMVATQLANGFIDAAAPCYIFLDDTQYLKSTAALECLQHLIDAAPAELRFVIASREEPGIPLGRLRALGRCFEIRPEHLRFDSSEIATYLTKSGHAALSATQLATLEARTEGWIVGLKLLSMTLRWKPQEEIGALTFSGEERRPPAAGSAAIPVADLGARPAMPGTVRCTSRPAELPQTHRRV
jgi:LuxR family maltose regulon positive regulatory protein